MARRRTKRCTCTARRWDPDCDVHDSRRAWADAYDDEDDEDGGDEDRPRRRSSRDAGGPSVVTNVTIDLSDEKAVNRAIGMGLLTQADVDDADKEDADAEEDADKDGGDESEGGKRRGYFSE